MEDIRRDGCPHKVELNESERTRLKQIASRGETARKVKRALVLLKADEGLTVASGLLISAPTIGRVPRGLSRRDSVNERPRPGQKRKLDGRQEAHLVAIACSDAPEAHGLDCNCPTRWWRWGLPHLPRDCAPDAQKNELKVEEEGMVHPRGEFVARMEDVLDLTMMTVDPDHPVVCFEASKHRRQETVHRGKAGSRGAI